MNYSVVKLKKGILNIETPPNIWIDGFNCLRSKAFSFRCANDNKFKLKGISKAQVK